MTPIKKKLEKLTSLCLLQNEKLTYFYEDINIENILTYNSDVLFYAASSIKILICVMLLELAEHGKLLLSDELLVTMEDLKQNTGVIKFQRGILIIV